MTNPTNPSTRSRRRGFTLIEVLLVLVILVILAGMAVTAYGPMQRSAYMRAAKTQIGAFRVPLSAYRLDMGDYPTTQQGGLQALRMAPADAGGGGRWMGPYLDIDVPNDPWGRPYQYEYSGDSDVPPAIWSMGPNGVSRDADDITSW